MILPNYSKNIKNISATFSKWLGKEDGLTLKILENELNKNYKNVIFMVCDGMGVDVLNKIGENTIMKNNIVDSVTSVFPSTTTNATTTMLTNTLVDTHKYLAWSMYFKKLNRCVDIYMAKDSYTGEHIENYLDTFTESYFNTFETNRKVCSSFPCYCKSGIAKTNVVADTIPELENALINLCQDDEPKFIYAYCPEPDSTMHEFGVSSSEAREKVLQIHSMLTNVINNTQDTLVVITADHGHIDVKGYINIYEDNEVMECLSRPLSMESRAVCFSIKQNYENQFLSAMQKYSQDITLIKSKDLIDKGVFGNNVDEELTNYLGDYIGVGTNTFKVVRFTKDKFMFKGHHTALTEEEMMVPLIFINNRKVKK